MASAHATPPGAVSNSARKPSPVERITRPPWALTCSAMIRSCSAKTLPIALAGAALLVAIAGTGYALVRIAPLRQQVRVGH